MGKPCDAMQPGQSFGQAGVMWLLAISDGPQTSSELTAKAPIGQQAVSASLTTLHRKGFVERQRRTSDRAFRGTTPYEYEISAERRGDFE